MARTKPFDQYPFQYEDWYERHKTEYELELQAIRRQLPETGYGIEIGVGTGRFAGPLGIKIGLEPAPKMSALARERGIEIVGGVAEALPFKNRQFDFALMVTVICFLDDVEGALKEAYRALKGNGSLIIGFIDKQSPLGREYEKHKDESTFYRAARFYSVDEVVGYLEKARFRDFRFTQTLFHRLDATRGGEAIMNGYGKGPFVVVRARK
jgi:SAM-dependent methyltransferase